jgi:hypothetical protein
MSPTRLVRLGLQREPHAVPAVDHVGGQRVDGLAVAVQRGLHVLGAVVLAPLAAAPHDEGLRAELGGQVEVAHDLAQGVAAHRPVVAGEAAVLEHRLGEQVGGDHRHDQAGVLQRRGEPVDLLVAGRGVRPERNQVVVVEGHAPRAEGGQLVHRLHRVQRGARRDAERVRAVPPDRPQSEGEPVGGGGLRAGLDRHGRAAS